jgi:hypothetical protein
MVDAQPPQVIFYVNEENGSDKNEGLRPEDPLRTQNEARARAAAHDLSRIVIIINGKKNHNGGID